MRRIGHLTEVAQANGNNKEVVDEIVALSKQYGIISAYTSFLVTDPSENGPVATNMGGSSRNMRFDFASNHFAADHKARGAAGIPVMQASVDKMSAGTNAAAPQSSPATMASPRLAMARGGSGGGGNFDQRSAFAKSPMAETSYASASSFSAQPTGKDAVDMSKQMNALKSTTVAYTGSKGLGAATVKVIEDKTFYSIEGVWTDSSYKADAKQAVKKISFGTDEYFVLVRKNPGIAKYLSVGQKVILVFKGTAYEITAGAAS
jgi:hypothetical protein